MRLLDLFCGGGLAGYGYWLSGRFTEIVGIDINDMAATYPFDFIRKDAMTLDYHFLQQFDFIHASPPCQAYSNLTPNDNVERPRLIQPVKHMLYASGIPHVVENVQGSVKELQPHISINGGYCGLPLNRIRHFYVSEGFTNIKFVKRVPGINVHGSQFVSRETLIYCFGLAASNISTRWTSNLSMRHIEEGIPPLFTQLLSETLVAAKALI